MKLCHWRSLALTSTVLLACYSVAAGQQSDPIVTVVTFQGAKSGTNTFTVKPDGSFVSETKMVLMGQDMGGTITGKLKDGVMETFVLKQNSPTGPMTITWDGKDLKLKAGGGEQTIPTKFSGPVFSSFHPQLTAAALKRVDWKKGIAQTQRLPILDNFQMMDISFTPLPSRTINGPKGKVVMKTAKIKLGPVEGSMSMTEDGVVLGFDVPSQRLKLEVEGYKDIFSDPLAKYPELSQPVFDVEQLDAVKVPVRDKTELVATIVKPTKPGKYPVIFSRTPYGRGTVSAEGAFWASRGYIFVGQDVRGTGDSKGVWDPFVFDRKDGKDSIDWIAKQPWCDGNVGMIGASYGGFVQWAAAVERPAALKCIVPQVSPPASAMMNLPYDNGAFMLFSNMWWLRIVDSPGGTKLTGIMEKLAHPEKLTTLPLSKVDDAVLGFNSKIFDKWLAREGEANWTQFSFAQEMKSVKIPALHISGWWDGDAIGTKTNWATVTGAGNKQQWLIYGPWPHAFNTSTKLGDIDYGPTSVLELDPVYLRWFDTWLKGKKVGLEKVNNVKAFVTGANKWVESSSWPVKESKPRSLYMQFTKDAATIKGKSKLVSSLPKASQGDLVFDPAKVVIPKAMLGNLEENNPESTRDEFKGDTIYLESDPMKSKTAIAGPFRVEFSFKTSAKDTDFFATLMDVAPNGKMRAIGIPGKLRTSYMTGLKAPKALTPNKVYRVGFDLWDSAHELVVGHKLALVITSNAFPAFARNMGTGEPIKDATKMVVQKNTILSDPKNPATLSFRVL